MKAKKAAAINTKYELVRAQNRVPKWVMTLVKVVMFLTDAVLVVACFAVAFKLREGERILSPTAWAWSKAFVPYAGILFFAVPMRLGMLIYERVYQLYGAFSYIEEFVKILKAVSVGSLLIVAFTFLFRGGYAFRDFSYSRGVFIVDFVISLVVFTVFHLGLRYLQTVVRERDINLIPTLIVGQNAEAAQTIKELKERRDLGYRVVGVIETGEAQRPEIKDQSVPIVGSLDDLSEVIRELAVQEVIITDSRIPGEKLFDAMMSLGRRQKVEFRLAPSLYNFLPQKTSVEQIGVLPMVRLFREPLSDTERFVKRASDIVVSFIVLAVLSPIWLLIAIFIKMSSRGAVFFRQERVGMDGRVFLCYKFRTMKTDADENLHRAAYRKNIEGTSEANIGDDQNPVFGKVKDDPRVTTAGKWLRRTSLDELPQFLNVLIGDMSIVGPRPPIPYEVVEYDLRHRRRLEMKPGITGLWQVSGRNRLSFEEMVQTDMFYIENWSLRLDLKIIFMTLPAMLRGDGAR